MRDFSMTIFFSTIKRVECLFCVCIAYDEEYARCGEPFFRIDYSESMNYNFLWSILYGNGRLVRFVCRVFV